MTRSMLAEVLYRYAGSPAVTGSGTYSDVPEGAYYLSLIHIYRPGLRRDAGALSGWAPGRRDGEHLQKIHPRG